MLWKMVTYRSAIKQTERSPLEASWCIFSGDSFVLDSLRLFQWFDSLDELAYMLRDIEPMIYEFDAQDVAPYQAKVQPPLDTLLDSGLSDALRVDFNSLVYDFMVIEWWGSLDDLMSKGDDFCLRVREDFRESEDVTVADLPSAEMISRHLSILSNSMVFKV